jgi:hypothetical protein
MKLELDLSSRATLLAQRHELERALRIIDMALLEMPEESPAVQSSATETEEIDKAKVFIETLPPIFTSSDVYKSLGNKIERRLIKMAIVDLCNRGILELAERGRGRKPNRYKKVNLAG